MSTITPNKTVNTSLISWQDVTNTNIVLGGAVDISGKYAASFGIRIARRTGTAFTSGWPNIRIEFSEKTSGNDGWFDVLRFQPMVGVNIVNTTGSNGSGGSIAAGASSFVVASATNISIGDILFLGDGSTANYELVRVKAISGTTITPEENVTFSHANGCKVTDQAEMYFPACDVTCYNRVRAIVDNSNSGQDISVQVTMTTLNSHTVA